MASFIIDFDPERSVLNVKFGNPATNAEIVQDAARILAEIKEDGGLQGGPLLRINGPASLPCAFTIGHAVFHAYGAIAVWDPKLQKYVVSISHNPDYSIGDLID
ncbi:MAG: CRISPR-associated protein Csx3 [Chloroflexi bacterium 13_1_20CM_50_12]|nr:MAG: CRISPR-associated protein Csx3 [Chloroflexi bacterium 13_1_20CM_50_12]